MKKLFKDLSKSEAGATAIEYGLIAALIAVALIAAVGNVGDTLVATFDSIAVGLGGSAAGGGAPPAP